MSLKVYHSKPYEHTVEDEGYWRGQMKSKFWLELHNEDVDNHYCNWDMEPHD